MSAPQRACYGRRGCDPRTHEKRTVEPMTTASPSLYVEARERGADDAEATSWLGVVAFGRVTEDQARHRSGEQVSVSGRLMFSRSVTGDL